MPSFPRAAANPSFPPAMLAVLALGAVAIWSAFGSDPIGPSWRECDTQAIARSLAFEDFDLLRPRVDWRGATSGEVECEFPLYQAIVACVLLVAGDVEWPGRLVSLLALVWLVVSWQQVLVRCASPAGAWLGVAALLGGAQAAHLGTRVMPDATSLAFGAAGLSMFVRHLDDGRGRTLAWATLWTLLGCLAKPTTLQFVALQAAFAFALQPARLRAARTWLAFGVVVAAVAAWTLHARAIGQATGLTFGVTFGDVKTPGLEHLLRPRLWLMLASSTLGHGIGWLGLAAAAALALRREVGRLDALFGVVVALGLVGSLRYSCDASMGPHYHAMSALFGSWCVARAWPPASARLVTAVAVALLLALGVRNHVAEAAHRPGRAPTGHDATAALVRAHAGPDDRIVVRAPKPAYDPLWARPNNFEEPVLFHLARRKGWSLPSDGVDPARLADCARQGARLYVETQPDRIPEALAGWLAGHAEVVAQSSYARIYRLERP